MKKKIYRFSLNEISELQAALDCKARRIKAGDYSQTKQERATDGKWIADIRKLIKKLDRKL